MLYHNVILSVSGSFVCFENGKVAELCSGLYYAVKKAVYAERAPREVTQLFLIICINYMATPIRTQTLSIYLPQKVWKGLGETFP